MIIRPLKPLLCLAALLTAPLAAQQIHEAPALLPPSRNLILLDPAHGGPDSGAHLKDSLLEKDVTLALANRLKTTLIAHGFQVISTRDGDNGPASDQRAELANHAHPSACVLIHASASGNGPYLAASSLPPDFEPRIALPWDTAQAAFVSDSLALLNLAMKAFASAKLPAISLRSSVPPIDSLTCPAILLELAPLGSTAITDGDYQQQVADALTAALTTSRDQADTTVAKPASGPQKKSSDSPAITKPPVKTKPGNTPNLILSRSWPVIPRYQRILFWTLTACVLVMFAFLLRGCEQVHKRLSGHNGEPLLAAPNATDREAITFDLANDTDASITPTQRSVSLPAEPTLRARAVLENLMTQYTATDSVHPLKAGPAVADVFLLTMPPSTSPNHLDAFSQGSFGETAVINLRGSFADAHPSGVVVETLTLQSIIGTLHATLPQVEQIRFLVDGKPRETLAGHASLLRAYPATDTSNRPLVPLTEDK